MAKLILFNKPFNTLSQFTDSQGRRTLAGFLNTTECEGCYAAGRLDYDSEGLMLLTNNGPLQHQITDPQAKCYKTYWAQVEGEQNDEPLRRLREGVTLKDGEAAATVKHINPKGLWMRTPPIRVRQSIPTHWIELSICEGRNRQIRRMTAAVGLPTLRLIRVKIGQWELGHLQPGQFSVQHVHTSVNLPKSQKMTRHKRGKYV